MRRLTRPLGYTAFALAALWGFIRLRTATPTPLDWRHPSDWLNRSDTADVLIEVARWVGIGLAAYVAFVAVLALVVELAAITRAVPLERAARFVGRLVAVPALRRRLLDASTAAAITVASLNVAVAGATAAPPPIAQTHDQAAVDASVLAFSLPATIDATMFRGFGYLPPTDNADPTTAAAAPDDDSAVVVRAGDTLWNIATDHYGFCDHDLIRIIRDANPTLGDPARIFAGQTIVLPELFPATTTPAPAGRDGDATWAVHVIVHGDTLWDILNDDYGHVDADLIWHIAEINGLEDPSDIPIGTSITLPPLDQLIAPDQPGGTIPTAEAEAPAASDEADPAALIPTPPVDDPTEGDAAPTKDDHVAPDTNADAGPVATPPPTPVVSEHPTEATSPTVSAAATEADGALASLAHRIGWQGSAALAAGMIALATQLRRQRRNRNHRPPTEPVRDVDLVMRTTPGSSNVEWAAETLRGLSSQLHPKAGRPCPTPLCVQLDDDGIEILWTEPRPHLIDGWTTPNDGRSWHRTRDLAPVETTVTAPCPALVTIGTHDGTQVLLNLEVPGVLSISGDRNAALDTARSICLELGSTPFKDVTNSLLCAFPLDGIEHLEWVQSVTADEAAHWLRERRESAHANLANSRLSSLFALRSARSKHDPHSPVVVIVDAAQSSAEDVQRLTDLADPSAGAVVIAIGAPTADSWALRCSSSATELAPLGLSLDPVSVTPSMSATIATFLDHAAGDDVNTGDLDEGRDHEHRSSDLADCPTENEPVAIATVNEADRPASDVAVAAQDGTDRAAEIPAPLVIFRILGPVGVDGLDVPLRPTELELGIYLALHRHGQTADTIRTMIWPNGSADKTWRNVSSSLRTKLGCDPDGTPRLSARGDLGRYFLSPSVTTDFDLLIAALQADRHPGQLVEDRALKAFDLVRGPLFSDVSSGYSWAFSDGTASRIEVDLLALAERTASDLEGADAAPAGHLLRARISAALGNADQSW